MHWHSLLTLGVLLFATSEACAFSPAPPKRHDVFSPNRNFVVDVNPNTETHIVYASNDRKNSLWSFKRPIGSEKFFLSDDGQVVVVVAGRYVWRNGLGRDCCEFWNAGGKFMAHSFRAICPSPRTLWFFEGPIGPGSCIWYDDVIQDGNTLHVRTTGQHDATFSLTDGELLSQEIAWRNLGSDEWLVSLVLMGLAAAVVLWRRERRKRRHDAPTHTADA
jgi:hypothetical protein